MVQYNPLQSLPTEDDLPDSDDLPVDNEIQTLIPALLRAILSLLWVDRTDWFFGINMGIYYDLTLGAIVPDAFLSLGVPRLKQERGRLSYILWQEDYIAPQWVLEVVSKTPGKEYDEKMTTYAEMGVLYYVIYNPNHWRRNRRDPFEVHRLENGVYVRQLGNPVWMPELGLGIGCDRGTHEGWTREWLYWYDSQGDRHPAPENAIERERQRAERERQRAERAEQQLADLMAKLKERGINLD
jgi:Uma2 family endonuclease